MQSQPGLRGHATEQSGWYPLLLAERGACVRVSPVGHGWPTEWARIKLAEGRLPGFGSVFGLLERACVTSVVPKRGLT